MITPEARAVLARLDGILHAAMEGFVAAEDGPGPGSDQWAKAQRQMADAAERLGMLAASHVGALLAALSAAEAERDRLRETLEDLVSIIDAAGLYNLSNGVQLGPTVWYVKASERLYYARAALAPAKGEGT
jgi:hypothetical protein